MRRESEAELMRRLDESSRRLEESQRRENQLKHRLDDLEREATEMRENAPPAKRLRLSDIVADEEQPVTPNKVETST